MTLSTENADAIITAWSPESSVDTVDLDGATAVVAETAGRVAIAWTVADGIEALFGFHGDRATAERIVRGLRAARRDGVAGFDHGARSHRRRVSGHVLLKLPTPPLGADR